MNTITLKNNYKINAQVIGAILSVFLVSVYTVFLSNRTMPTAEGWYSYYAKCILDGQTVYTDFEYLFTPIYMYIIAGFVKIFGYSLLALRIFGVIIYAIITFIIYYILVQMFSVKTSIIGTVTGIFYLQSEVYTVFYDYIRVMDIFSYLSILFMVLFLKNLDHKRKRRLFCFWWGFCTALFLLVKQNMGGLFVVYSIVLFIFAAIILTWKIKRLVLSLCNYLIGFAIPLIILVLITLNSGMFYTMLDSVFFGAIEAKGGIDTILFNWIINGYTGFLHVTIIGFLFLLIIILNKKIHYYTADYSPKSRLLVLYCIIMVLGIVGLCHNETWGTYFASIKRLDVTVIFIVTVVLMFYLAVISLYNRITKREPNIQQLQIISLLGAFFAICYGVGMSGGLSIGESAYGLALIICIIFESFNHSYAFIPRILLVTYCVYLSFACIGYKLINPCSWWGIDEASVYVSTHDTNVSALRGIKLSEDVKNMYEEIVQIVDNNTNEGDPIYCFPHIPLFYVLCDRNDPGVYSKVQWFDVSTNQSVVDDIDILNSNLPHVIIIYNLYDWTYQGHETSFNYGEISGTRQMRDALYELVNQHSYTYQGTYVFDDNNISVYVLEDGVKLNDIFERGTGTLRDPYIVDTTERLVNLAMLSNQGYNLNNIYFKQTIDLDLSDIVWVPFDYYGSFNGYYITNNCEVTSINQSNRNSDNPYGTEFGISTSRLINN